MLDFQEAQLQYKVMVDTVEKDIRKFDHFPADFAYNIKYSKWLLGFKFNPLMNSFGCVWIKW